MSNDIDTKETARCRGCHMKLAGTPYHKGGDAYIPHTMERAPINHFGGYVCSYQCDVKVCLEMLSSMPGAGKARSLDSACREKVERNWPNE